MITPTVRTRWHVGLAAAALVAVVLLAFAVGWTLGGEPERPVPEPDPTGTTPPWTGRLFDDAPDGGDRP